ncbi:MAG: hypothetical protein ACHQ1D_00420 [Nitrososphaerales archaeon]
MKIVKQREENDCLKCSLAMVLGLPYEEAPGLDMRLPLKRRLNKFHRDLKVAGYEMVSVSRRPKKGIITYHLYYNHENYQDYHHARPIIKGREYEVNHDRQYTDKLIREFKSVVIPKGGEFHSNFYKVKKI